VQKPIKVIVTNFPEDKVEYFEVSNNPQNPEAGTRQVAFTRELYIDEEDFAEVPPPKFFRLKPDGEVRLMGGYIIKYAGIEKNEDGSIKCIHATADLETGNGNPVDGRKIKGTIHWVSAKYAKPVTIMNYDKLFTLENLNDMPEDKTYDDYLNTESVVKLENALVEPSALEGDDTRFQFVRNGYYVKDSKNPETFNKIVGLKGSFVKK
jgi:glutaminyl-tRNA synthetase